MHIEQANLYAAANYAATHGLTEFAVTLPAAMHGYLRHHGNWDRVSLSIVVPSIRHTR